MQTDRQTDRQASRQAGRQTHTDAHACIHISTPQTHMPTYIAYAHPCMHMPAIYRLGLASASVELLEVVVPRSCAFCNASWKSLCWSRCFPREIGLGQVSTCFSLRLCELSGLVCVIQKATARSWNNDPHEPMQWTVKKKETACSSFSRSLCIASSILNPCHSHTAEITSPRLCALLQLRTFAR